MIEIVKTNKKIEEILKIVDYKSIYKMIKDEKVIGYGTINKDQENVIYIFIQEEYRGNGYGKILFHKMIEETKKEGFKEIKLKFERNNIQMLKIVTKEGGLHLSTMGENVQYLIPIK